MNTQQRHIMWELKIAGSNALRHASTLLNDKNNDDHLISTMIKQRIAQGEVDGQPYLRCSHCNVPVRHNAGNINKSAFFYHQDHDEATKKAMHNCPLYVGNQTKLFSEIYNGEGPWHLNTKHTIQKILESSSKIIKKSIAVERYIFDDKHVTNVKRRPDIFFCDHDGNEWVIELTRWWMKPSTVIERENFYREKGINLLWLFSAECQANNKTTFNYIMYGSNEAGEYNSTLLSDNDRPHFNAFVFSPSALTASKTKHDLIIDIIYPRYTLGNGDCISPVRSYDCKQISIHELSLSPTRRLPYGVETQQMREFAIQEAKHLFDEREALTLEKERRYKRRIYAQHISDLRSNFRQAKRDINQLQNIQNFEITAINKQLNKLKNEVTIHEFSIATKRRLHRNILNLNVALDDKIEMFEQHIKKVEAERKSFIEQVNELIDFFLTKQDLPNKNSINKDYSALIKKCHDYGLNTLQDQLTQACKHYQNKDFIYNVKSFTNNLALAVADSTILTNSTARKSYQDLKMKCKTKHLPDIEFQLDDAYRQFLNRKTVIASEHLIESLTNANSDDLTLLDKQIMYQDLIERIKAQKLSPLDKKLDDSWSHYQDRLLKFKAKQMWGGLTQDWQDDIQYADYIKKAHKVSVGLNDEYEHTFFQRNKKHFTDEAKIALKCFKIAVIAQTNNDYIVITNLRSLAEFGGIRLFVRENIEHFERLLQANHWVINKQHFRLDDEVEYRNKLEYLNSLFNDYHPQAKKLNLFHQRGAVQQGYQ